MIGDAEVHGEMPYAFFHEGKHDYDAHYGRPHEGVDPELGHAGPHTGSSEEDSRKGDKQA